MSQPERRRHPRIDVNLALRLTISGNTVETRITNLSNSGIRFRTPDALPLLSRVQIALELPGPEGDKSALAITGVVVRSEKVAGEDTTPWDTAIYFEDLSEGSRSRLTRFVTNRE